MDTFKKILQKGPEARACAAHLVFVCVCGGEGGWRASPGMEEGRWPIYNTFGVSVSTLCRPQHLGKR